MRIPEAWTEASGDLNHLILESAYLHDKTLYRKLNQEMASNLRRRLTRILDLPRRERHDLYHPLLGTIPFAVLAQSLAVNWLSHEGNAMMSGFLDALSIPHDGHGCAQEFPESVPDKKLKSAVNQLSQSYPSEDLYFYLGIFEDLSGTQWDGLRAVRETLKN